MQVLYYLGLTACHFCITFTGVRYGRGTKGFFSLALSSCVTCIIASLFFLSLTGFQPKLNSITALYAIVFAAICLVSQYTGFSIYRHTDVAGRGMIAGGFSLLLNCAAGIFLFRETFTFITAIRIACMLCSGVAVYFHNRRFSTGKWTRLGWVLIGITIINGVASNVISKFYAIDARVTDNNSYCMLVNVFCLAFSLAMVLMLKRGNLHDCIDELRVIRPKHYLYVVLNTVSGNLNTLLTLAILAGGDMLLYIPLNSALGLLTTQLVAVVFEKEKFMPIPVVLSLTAAVLSFWR